MPHPLAPGQVDVVCREQLLGMGLPVEMIDASLATERHDHIHTTYQLLRRRKPRPGADEHSGRAPLMGPAPTPEELLKSQQEAAAAAAAANGFEAAVTTAAGGVAAAGPTMAAPTAGAATNGGLPAQAAAGCSASDDTPTGAGSSNAALAGANK